MIEETVCGQNHRRLLLEPPETLKSPTTFNPVAITPAPDLVLQARNRARSTGTGVSSTASLAGAKRLAWRAYAHLPGQRNGIRHRFRARLTASVAAAGFEPPSHGINRDRRRGYQLYRCRECRGTNRP
jgi:hypothetical protein